MAGYLHHTAQPSILAAFLPWGVSTGAGRARPAGAKVVKKKVLKKGAYKQLLLPSLHRINGGKTHQRIMLSSRLTVVNKNRIIIFCLPMIAFCFRKIIQ